MKISIPLISGIATVILICTTCKKEPEATPPAAPLSLQAVAFSASQINLAWTDKSDDETGFAIDRSPDNSSWAEIANVGENVTTYQNTGLNQSTTYYYRVKAYNAAGSSSYTSSANATTQTLTSLATLTTTSATSITTNSASSGGNITGDGGAAVTARGVCWSTSSNPTTANSKTSNGTGTGTFTSSITGLSGGTLYYVRAYATNSVGTAYGNQVSFTTSANPVVPSLTTTSATSITTNSASSGGNITSDGGAAVTARGVCWSTSSNPTTANSKTSNGTGTGTFTSSITGLNAGTLYYVRAYATNSVGTAYGNQVSFTTSANPVVPSLTTTAVTNITSSTATSGGNITSDGGASVTARGVCWNTTGTPTTANSKTSDGTGTGAFTSNITGLAASTTYYLRAYATNSAGTAYGSQQSFTTSGTLPAAPSNLTATPISNTQIDLSWTDNSSNETGFRIERSPNNSSWTEIGTTNSNITTYQNTGLTASTTYYYRVRAYNATGNSGYTSSVNATTPAVSPISLTGPSSATASFTLTWTYTWPALGGSDDHYELEWSYSATSGFAILATYPNGVRTTPYSDVITPEAVDIGKTTYFRVRAKAAGSYTPYSNVVGVNIPYINISFNPTLDNLLMSQSNNSAVANTVYATSSLASGTNYIIGVYVNDYLIGASTLYFNINNYISGGTIQKALLRLYVEYLPADWNTTYIVNPLAANWNTNTITFNNQPSYYTSPSATKAPPTSGAVPWEIDITSIVQTWANGSRTNYGILIRDNNIAWPASTAYRATQFYSIETAPSGKKPTLYLEIR